MLPNRATSNPDNADPTATCRKPTLPGQPSDEPLTNKRRAQAGIETINNMFAAGITPANRTPLERREIFSHDIKNILFETIEFIRQFIRLSKLMNPRNDYQSRREASCYYGTAKRR